MFRQNISLATVLEFATALKSADQAACDSLTHHIYLYHLHPSKGSCALEGWSSSVSMFAEEPLS